MLLHEDEREDLQRKHARGLHQVVRGGVPQRDDARVHDVDAAIVQDARHVPRHFRAIEEERGALKGNVRILVHPNEELVQDEEQQHDDDVYVQTAGPVDRCRDGVAHGGLKLLDRLSEAVQLHTRIDLRLDGLGGLPHARKVTVKVGHAIGQVLDLGGADGRRAATVAGGRHAAATRVARAQLLLVRGLIGSN